MAETFHLGDCSTGCDECGRRCVERDHEGCTGSDEEQDYAESLLADADLATLTSQRD